jgi:anti-anti-sigma factor
MDFFSALSLCAPNAHLLIKGELDAFAATALHHHLDGAVDRGCICYSVDASAVTFIDAGGLGMLVRLSNAVTPFGGAVTVTTASPRFRQVAELGGLRTALGLDLIPDDQTPAPRPTARGQVHVPARRPSPVAGHPARAAGPHPARSAEQRLRLGSAR